MIYSDIFLNPVWESLLIFLRYLTNSQKMWMIEKQGQRGGVHPSSFLSLNLIVIRKINSPTCVEVFILLIMMILHAGSVFLYITTVSQGLAILAQHHLSWPWRSLHIWPSRVYLSQPMCLWILGEVLGLTWLSRFW